MQFSESSKFDQINKQGTILDILYRDCRMMVQILGAQGVPHHKPENFLLERDPC